MSIRVRQVEELLREQVSVLIRENLPEELGMVTVTDVHASADLKNAVLYVCASEKNKEEKVLKILKAETPTYQRILGQKLKMRFTPKLSFKIDDSSVEINHVEEILKEIDRGT